MSGVSEIPRRVIARIRRIRASPGRHAQSSIAPDLHLAPLDHLPELLASGDLTADDLNPIGHRLDAAARTAPTDCASRLYAALETYTGPVTPTVNRLVLHALDAEWRSHTDNAIKGKALRKRLPALQARFAELPAIRHYQGALALRGGDRASAYSLMYQAAMDTGPVGLPWMHIGAHSMRIDGPADWQSLPDQTALPGTVAKAQWHQLPLSKGEICLLAGGDGAFFQAYGADLHASLRQLDQDCNIHIHVVNFTPGCAALVKRLNDPRLSITTEPYAVPGDMSFFAVARFYRLSEIQETLDLPICVTDLDNTAAQAPTTALSALRDLDAGFNTQTNQTWFPWWGPTAWNSFVNTTTGGREIARWMRVYTAARFQVGKVFRSWWFDQLMLNEIEHLAQAQGLRIETTRVPSRMVTKRRPDTEVLAIRKDLKAGMFNG